MAHIHLRIMELLQEKGLSKSRVCSDLEFSRGNFNRYCRDEFQRIDADLIVRLCKYLECDIPDLIVLVDDEHS